MDDPYWLRSKDRWEWRRAWERPPVSLWSDALVSVFSQPLTYIESCKIVREPLTAPTHPLSASFTSFEIKGNLDEPDGAA